ncbi:MAG: ABC transporter ATP-binding protein [Fimbriimonadaceae bacterium]|nr:ABC transporter ATP-binding protein [Fimbriimonadaceae bacterium]
MLEVQNLSKTYGGLNAVSNVSFTLQPGDIFGFIGSNGAGKTTTIKMISTLLEPTAGTAVLDGFDIMNDPMEVRRRIGYMPDFFGLYDDVRVWEYLDFFATIYRVPASERQGVISNVLELTDLTFKRDAMVASLSRGMQQRLCLARCLVHDPTLLLLDEPASGLDPRARAELKELLAELGRMGKIILVSSHILPELADFCTKVGIIERGELLAFGPVNEIARGMEATKVLEIRLTDRAGDASMFLHGKPGVNHTFLMGASTVKIDFSGTEHDQVELLRTLVTSGFPVMDFREQGADLEDVFLRVTKGALN